MRANSRLRIANEFAEVFVEPVVTRNGVRLRISSPRLGYSVALDAMNLESLTWQEASELSKFLVDPFGPSPGGNDAFTHIAHTDAVDDDF